MPTPPPQPPGGSQPGNSQPGNSQPGAARPGIAQPGVTRPGTAQPGDTDDGTCPRVGQRPLPDPAAVRLLAVPDSAPPYDDALTGLPPGDLALRTGGATWADDRGEPGRAARPGADQAAAAGSEPTGDQVWPSRFAQVLVETLAGSRPPRQMVPWTTQRARSNIQRLGPTLSAGQPAARQRPLVRRVVTSRPTCDVVEMTVICGFGPRIRALAVRLERTTPRDATPGQPARAARWLCTAVEAA
ncbi:MAG TPA: Rv3235 family protein [Streptosporangiaceae bacterium]